MYQHSGYERTPPPSPPKAAKKFPDTNATPPHGTPKPTPPHEKFAYPSPWAGTPRPRIGTLVSIDIEMTSVHGTLIVHADEFPRHRP